MKRLLIFYLLTLAGCAAITDVDKGKREMGRGNYIQARKYYYKALNNEKKDAAIPKWDGRRCAYDFNEAYTAQAIYGIAESYRANKQHDQALYYYFYYTQFCLRHGIYFKHKTEDISSYIIECKTERSGK